MVTNINEFAKAVIAEMENMLSDVEMETTEVDKANGEVMTGIVIRRVGEDAGPQFYVNEAFAEWLKGKNLSDITTELVAAYSNCNDYSDVEDFISIVRNWDEAKDLLSFRVLELERNKSFADALPHFDLGCGLAGFPVIAGDTGLVRVSRELLKEWGIVYENDIFELAQTNAYMIGEPELMSMDDMFSGNGENLLKGGHLSEGTPMYVLSNKTRCFGASALFYPAVQQKIFDILGEYFVLPSSVHEVIIVPKSAGLNLHDLQEMVKSVNDNEVDAQDILSYNVFQYASGALSIA